MIHPSTGVKDEHPYVFGSQFTPFDFRSDTVPFGSESAMVNWQYEIPGQESFIYATPLMQRFYPFDPMYASLDIDEEFSSTTKEDKNEVSIWKELGPLFPKREVLMISDNTNKDSSSSGGETVREEKKVKRFREEKSYNNSVSKGLSRELISKYFYMPITQAAKELNVGLTLLKKRCRELGIRRWPHRKLMSIQTLIKNVQEMKKVEGEESERKLREAIGVLENEKKMLEEMPDMQLEHKTKRLRQACFKANYKKRKQMGILDKHSFSSPISAVESFYEVEDEDDNDDIKSLLKDLDSYDNVMF